MKASFLRISATVNALRIVESIGVAPDGLGYPSTTTQVPPAASIASRAERAEAVRVDGQRLGELALGEHLDRDVLARWPGRRRPAPRA